MPDYDAPPSPGVFRSYLQLLRAPNIPTAMADVTMGFLLVSPSLLPGAWTVSGELTRAGWWMLGLLLASSGLLYAAGVVLNDLMDLERDRQERPDRPLPSGRVSLRAARWLGGEMLLVGTALPCAMAWKLWQLRPDIVSLRPAGVAVGLALAILLYDGLLKRTLLGPLAMGGCRMLNVLLGMSVAAGRLEGQHWLVAGAIGLYVAGVTWFAREEVLRSDRRRLAAATVVMAAGVGLLAFLPQLRPEILVFPSGWYFLVAALDAIIVMRCLTAVVEPSPGRVRVAVGQAILSLVFLDVAVTLAARGLWAGALLFLFLLVPAVVLRLWIDAT